MVSHSSLELKSISQAAATALVGAYVFSKSSLAFLLSPFASIALTSEGAWKFPVIKRPERASSLSTVKEIKFQIQLQRVSSLYRCEMMCTNKVRVIPGFERWPTIVGQGQGSIGKRHNKSSHEAYCFHWQYCMYCMMISMHLFYTCGSAFSHILTLTHFGDLQHHLDIFNTIMFSNSEMSCTHVHHLQMFYHVSTHHGSAHLQIFNNH